MNIHEHQAKQILKKFGAKVPDGIFGFTVDEIVKKAKSLNTKKYVLKAQIHAGGRGKAGGIKIVDDLEQLSNTAKELLGKKLITNQTGPKGREVKRLYVEQSSSIEKEFYLSCLVDRKSSKIAFISSDQGGLDIEKIAKENPEKIITTKVDLNEEISKNDCEKIIEIYKLDENIKDQATSLIQSIFKMFNKTDASLVEINPLILTKENQIICLDTTDGSRIWNVVSISSFIKSQNLMSLALTKNGNLIALNSSADLFSINSTNGDVSWATNTLASLYTDAADFFKSSDVVIKDDQIIFSTSSSVFSYNLKKGFLNWSTKAQSSSTPIIDGKNIFIITENGYLVIINKNTGKIISSKNILKILKKRHRETKVTGFIMGSGKIYSVTLNGNLIVSSAATGEVEYFKKIGDPITTPPIIKDGKLYILTENSRIIGLN